MNIFLCIFSLILFFLALTLGNGINGQLYDFVIPYLRQCAVCFLCAVMSMLSKKIQRLFTGISAFIMMLLIFPFEYAGNKWPGGDDGGGLGWGVIVGAATLLAYIVGLGATLIAILKDPNEVKIDNIRRLKAVAILSLLGVPSYILNWARYICTDGYMQYDSYRYYQKINDIWWVTCFLAVFGLSFRLQAKGRILFLCGSMMLILLRFPFGGIGFGGIIFASLLLFFIVISAIIYLLKPQMHIISAKQAHVHDADKPSR